MKWYWWVLIVFVVFVCPVIVMYFIGKNKSKNDQLAKAREAKAEKNKLDVSDTNVGDMEVTV
jgi:phosphotransferase system  glucose/maltose/N-acetylglucosamine-specific IIC component